MPGAEERLVPLDDRHDLAQRERQQRVGHIGRHELGVVDEVIDARRHAQQLGDGDLVTVRDAGNVPCEPVIEADLAFVHELEDRRCGEGFGDAADAEMIIRLQRRVGGQVTDSQRLDVAAPARNPDAHVEAGSVGRSPPAGDDLLKDPAGRRAERSAWVCLPTVSYLAGRGHGGIKDGGTQASDGSAPDQALAG